MNNVSDADQAAFKVAAAEIRAALRALKRERWKQQWGPKPVWSYNRRPKQRPVSLDQLDAMHQRLRLIQEQLRRWERVLMADERRIRSPVRLWDAWHKLRDAADFEAAELEYLSEGRIPRTYVDLNDANIGAN